VDKISPVESPEEPTNLNRCLVDLDLVVDRIKVCLDREENFGGPDSEQYEDLLQCYDRIVLFQYNLMELTK
jgi:hypothetical protein